MNPWLDVLAKLRAKEAAETAPPEPHQAGADAACVVALFQAKTPEHEPTEPTKPLFVGFVGALPSTFSEICIGSGSGGGEPTKPTKPKAGAEQTQRNTRLQAAGLSQGEAQALAAKLAERDAEGGWNGLRVCLECQHCHGQRGGWWCAAYRAAGSSAPALGQDFPMMLKRCPAFALAGGANTGASYCGSSGRRKRA